MGRKMDNAKGVGHEHRGDLFGPGLALEDLHMADVFVARQAAGLLVDRRRRDSLDVAGSGQLAGLEHPLDRRPTGLGRYPALLDGVVAEVLQIEDVDSAVVADDFVERSGPSVSMSRSRSAGGPHL